MKLVVAGFGVLLLVGCAPAGQSAPGPGPAGDATVRCQELAAVVTRSLGQPWDAVRVQLAVRLDGVTYRALTPDMAATMDYNPGRLTVSLDRGRRIVEARCT